MIRGNEICEADGINKIKYTEKNYDKPGYRLVHNRTHMTVTLGSNEGNQVKLCYII